MTAIVTDILGQTLRGLEAGFQVRHIASFDLAWCDVDDDLDSVVGNPRFEGFDHIPVRRGFEIVGVIEPSRTGDAGRIEDAMQPIVDSMLVSGDEPLAWLVRRITDVPYRLVVTGSTINGIVTRSDVHKLPVRLLTFAMVTHLEMTMATMIRQRCPTDPEWFGLLKDGRQAKVKEKYERQRADRIDPSLLELTDFCDKRRIVKMLYGLSREFESHLIQIEKLRNSVAHAASYAADAGELACFVRRFKLAERWISELEALHSSI